MEKTILISGELYERLANMAVGFDTPESVIERLVGFVESNRSNTKSEMEKMADFHTKALSVSKASTKPRSITEAMARKACSLGDLLSRGEVSQDKARMRLVDMGMNSSSAHIYLYNYVAMRNGKVFKRSMKLSDIEMFLDHILDRYGDAGLRVALASYEQHVLYSEKNGFATTKKRPLLEDMKKKLRRRSAE
ncbi:MAG: Uncharacterised protein [Alphaproteobacteria bacterium]|nr:MAG: Uncharacterised protein [Alphaproteobacteria bacterium]